MHPSVLAYVAEMADVYGLGYLSPVLEVGSYNENGTVRPFLSLDYTGVDTRDGPGVDKLVTAGDPLPWDKNHFGLVVSTETLEHDPLPWITVTEMARVCREGGAVLITARGYDTRGCYPPHGEAEHGDFWRYSVKGLTELVSFAGLRVLDARRDPDEVGVFVTARKP